MSTWKIVLKTIVISLVFLAILYFLGKTNVQLEPVHVFIALIPFIILLVVSGKLKEIKGPGGLALSLRDEVKKPVSPEQREMKLELDPAIVMHKGSEGELERQITKDPPTTLSFRINRKGYYGEWAIDKYIHELEKLPCFRNVLFANEEGRFKGLMKLNDFKSFLHEHKIVEELESGKILEDSRVIKDSVQIGSTNQLTLSEMERVGKNILAVVDQHDKFLGTITQEEIVRKVLTKVLREA
jgi:hypothetical protein